MTKRYGTRHSKHKSDQAGLCFIYLSRKTYILLGYAVVTISVVAVTARVTVGSETKHANSCYRFCRNWQRPRSIS
jgi:hypothetical protein